MFALVILFMSKGKLLVTVVFKKAGAEKVTNDAIFTILLQGCLLTRIAEVMLADAVSPAYQPRIS